MTRLCHLLSLENFTFHLLHLYLAFFSPVYQIQPYGPTLLWADFAMCRVVLAVYLIYFSYLTLFSRCNYYKNNIFINSHSLTCFFFDEKHLRATVFYFMDRVCYGPSL